MSITRLSHISMIVGTRYIPRIIRLREFTNPTIGRQESITYYNGGMESSFANCRIRRLGPIIYRLRIQFYLVGFIEDWELKSWVTIVVVLTIVTRPMYRGWLKNVAICSTNCIVRSAFAVPFGLAIRPRDRMEVPIQPSDSSQSAAGYKHCEKWTVNLWLNPFWLPGAVCKQRLTRSPNSLQYSIARNKYLHPIFSTYGSVGLTFSINQYGKDILTWSKPAWAISRKLSLVQKLS